MKIINKLLPIATVASLATIVVPLATSCSTTEAKTNKASYSFDFEQNVKKEEVTKPWNPYVSKVTPAECVSFSGIDADEAKQIYFDKLDEDLSVFADDMLAQFQWQIYWATDYSSCEKYKGNADVVVNSFDSETGKISVEIRTKCQFSYYATWLSSPRSVEYSIDRTIKVNNLPIAPVARESSSSWFWAIGVDGETALEDADDFSLVYIDRYSIDEDVYTNDITWTTENSETSVITMDYEGDTSQETGMEVFESIMYTLSPSHYLLNNFVVDPS